MIIGATAAAAHAKVIGSRGMRNRTEVITSVWKSPTTAKIAQVGQNCRHRPSVVISPIAASVVESLVVLL